MYICVSINFKVRISIRHILEKYNYNSQTILKNTKDLFILEIVSYYIFTDYSKKAILWLVINYKIKF